MSAESKMEKVPGEREWDPEPDRSRVFLVLMLLPE
jgi:hypothetical protein